MSRLPQNNGGYGGGGSGGGDPNAILNECREIDRGIDAIEQNLEQLRMLQQRTLDDADSSAGSATNRQLDALSSETMAMYRGFTERVRQVKSNPDSRLPKNSPQVGRVDRRLKAAIQQYQQLESQFRRRMQDQMARQYRIVRPEASEEEVRAAVEDVSGGQVFSQALMQSDRRGQARAALSAVQDRHAALQKIERQMVELAQLFQDMDTLVMQQDVAVAQIEQKAEEVVENLDKGNEEIGVAVVTARKTRKKKWICLGICGKPCNLGGNRRKPLQKLTLGFPNHSGHHHCHRRCCCRLRPHHQTQGWQQQRQAQHCRPDAHRHHRRRLAGRPRLPSRPCPPPDCPAPGRTSARQAVGSPSARCLINRHLRPCIT